jgi:Lar family restriction alleviation protein
MTNGEKYKTASERRFAYAAYSHKRDSIVGEFLWLELEAKEEELLPCPFCGGRAEFNKTFVEGSTDGWVQCTYCGVHFITKERDEVIAAWNRRV